ncbi:heavy metal translocating P-type ATPase [Clostridium sp. C8]|uniref:Cadmium, zinc and cobalt-transporting ATPase n=1 Tax=bioreactor metagenome TaxID=1076179 RepID=A0A644WUM2_9ZZZZ|nr:heavy metal translocating P-type ATPase [Clostridium sp. C8]KLE15713.1 zinc ABC transporter ATPase [Clostridium sp. C8]
MKKRLWKIIIGAIVFAAAMIINLNIEWLNIALFMVSYVIVGGDVVQKAVKNIFRGKVFDESFLMTIATIGALLIGEYPEGVAVMLFYQIGELFQSYAVDKSRKSIADLMDIRPDYANVKKGDELVKTDPDEVKIGDIIVIKAGEKIPLDGKVIEGSSMVDTSALTGESVPREVEVGNEILSGCININGVITAEVTKEFEESTVSKILDLVENASSKKSNSEQFITKFARYYTPVVVIIAVFLAIIPPLVIEGATFGDWIYRALSFLVVSCPCALVISIPLSFFGGIGGASRKGILVKGSNYLEALAETEIVVFDKTGTLTKGVFNVQEINPIGDVSNDELLELTAYAESYSNHPISISLKRAYGKEIDNGSISDVEEISGHGVSATVNGKKVLAGNIKLMKKMNIPYFQGELIGTVVHVAIDGLYAGYIVIADEIKGDSAQAIKELKAANIKQTVMLTGDNKSVGSKVGKELGLDKVYAELLPGDKVDKLEELFSQKSVKGKLAFVGDGINDAPVLARADIGIAMGGLGSDAAIEAADIVIMTDEPSKIATAMKISKKTLKIAQQNIVFAIGIKIIVLILSALGITTMWAAIFADVGVTIIAVLNAFRALNVKDL